jgi:hypothetical protein
MADDRREFACALLEDGGAFGGTAAFSLTSGRLWFSLEVDGAGIVAAAVLGDPRHGAADIDLVRAPGPSTRIVFGWLGGAERRAFEDGVRRRGPLRVAVVAPPHLLNGTLREFPATCGSRGAKEE